jgi:hypothetical protein
MEITPQLRHDLARYLSETRGEPVMYYDFIPPENIEVAHAQIYENMEDLLEI